MVDNHIADCPINCNCVQCRPEEPDQYCETCGAVLELLYEELICPNNCEKGE